VLKMVNGVLVLVDACEGPMPQTRFVMQKALELNHKLIIVVNKTDRPDARLSEVQDEILELLFDLNANDEQIDSPIIFWSGRNGTASTDCAVQGKDLKPLFDAIINYFEPQEVDEDGPFQMLVSSIDYNDYVGRIGIGRIERGKAAVGQEVETCNYNVQGKELKGKLVSIFQIEGLDRVPVDSAKAGDIVCISGLENVSIGDTVCAVGSAEPVPFVKISEPTVEMTFSVNDSPFAGKEGKFVTTRHLRDRLFREMLKDVSLRVEETDSADSYRVCSRGEMHLSILIETMRRAGYEFQVGAPKVMYKTENGVLKEPMEKLVVDVPEDKTGSVFSGMGVRKGELLQMENIGSRIRLEFKVPARGLFGYKSQFLTETRGEGVFNTIFWGYEEYKGDIERRTTGSLVAFETGEAVTYGLFNAQGRGQLFIGAGEKVYEGMVVGVSPKNEDIVVNVCKKKHLTNTRASGSDDALRLETPKIMSLEEAMEFIADDELLEITPEKVRIRKKTLDTETRLKRKAHGLE
ncbi:MAG: translational GTPase TypA, partial [Clostridia bacterium]|nr:translational GTPase TypA [Clostridia bacterium]